MPAEIESETREGKRYPILVAPAKFCAINIHFQYDAPNERLHELQRVQTHTQHGNDTCIYSASVCFVCCCVCRSEAFTVFFLWLALVSFSLSLYLCSYVSMFQCCTSVWLELILLGLITSWQIRTPHLLKCTHTRVLAFTFDCMQYYCCYLRFLNPLIIDWSIVSVIFQSIDQAYVASFGY